MSTRWRSGDSDRWVVGWLAYWPEVEFRLELDGKPKSDPEASWNGSSGGDADVGKKTLRGIGCSWLKPEICNATAHALLD